MSIGRMGAVGALLLVTALAGAACDGGAGDASTSGGDSFLAFASSFAGYRSWTTYVVDTSLDPPASTHLSGPRTVYINHAPPHGATEFPVGTIIVKELDEGALAERQVFAMVKRGGDYNSQGATGWEWFELGNLDDANVRIVWRGVGPPAGEKYGGDPNGGCNGCHAAAADNDFVQASVLDLASF